VPHALFLVAFPDIAGAMRSTYGLMAALVTLFVGTSWSSDAAAARPVEECKTRWGSAVRSYLTKNRRAGPDGRVPKDIDEAEEVVQAWIAMFNEPCRLEASGERRKGRLLAASRGTATLAKLDPTACQRFLQYFMKAKTPEQMCQAAVDGASSGFARQLAGALKHHRRLAVPWVPDR